MEGAVYCLCALLALACALLLLRGFSRSRARLLLWCGFFFLALVLENSILFADLVLLPHVDLSLVRHCVALAGTALLLFGLIWEVK